jgi:hypothetical protein
MPGPGGRLGGYPPEQRRVSAAEPHRVPEGEIVMTQGTRRLFIVLSAGMVALALGAGAVRPAPARADSSAPQNYVALGDSYSSGDGVGADLNAVCHQSSSAWPVTVGHDLGFSGSDFIFRACTGSKLTDPNGTKLGDLTGTEQVPDAWGLTVGTWPAQEIADSAGDPSLTSDTRLVTLTWGGNDVNFGNVLIACVLGPVCSIGDSGLDAKIAQLEPTLVKAYEEIANKAPRATIIVMGYPRFFPLVPPVLCSSGAGTFFNRWQMIWMDSEVQNLDSTINTAVSAAQQTYGNRIQFVSGSYDAFTGHELCTANPYFNPMVPSYLIASFHPNGAGNETMARLAETSAGTVLPTDILMPNVIGLTATNAVSAIRSAGLVPIEVSSVDTSCNNIGYVINQSPQAGTPIATGNPVTITVAVKPPNPCP